MLYSNQQVMYSLLYNAKYAVVKENMEHILKNNKDLSKQIYDT
jgi:hypothetical protein